MKDIRTRGTRIREAVSWRLVRLMQIASKHLVMNSELNPLVQEFAQCMETLDAHPENSAQAVRHLIEVIREARSNGYSPGIRCCSATTASIDAWASNCIETLEDTCRNEGLILSP